MLRDAAFDIDEAALLGNLIIKISRLAISSKMSMPRRCHQGRRSRRDWSIL